MSHAAHLGSEQIINEATAPVTSRVAPIRSGVKRTMQATGQTTAGAGAATIVVGVSNDGVNFITAATIVLVLAASPAVATDGFALDAAWRFIRADLTAISGTGAAVSVFLGGL